MYSRDNPSPRYRELLEMYRSMHRDGYKTKDKAVAAQDAFPGDQLARYAEAIKTLIDSTGAKSIVDYGAGKGKQYGPMEIKGADGRVVANSIQAYWGVETLVLFDPGVPSHDTLPPAPLDGLVSTDVMEHIPRADVVWVVEEMFALARKFVFANVSCCPAMATLPDGSNAHETVAHPQWWAGVFEAVAQKHPLVSYHLSCMGSEVGADGSLRNGMADFGRILET